MRFLPFLLAFVLSTWSFSSYAWWNEDWTSRKKITLTGPSGEVADVPVLIRLHTGNFDFFSVNDNGGDVRLVAGDDKTELKFHFEKWDVANELALIWVKVPRLSAQTEIFLFITVMKMQHRQPIPRGRTMPAARSIILPNRREALRIVVPTTCTHNPLCGMWLHHFRMGAQGSMAHKA